MIEMVIGVVFAAIVLALPYIHERVGKIELGVFKLPKFLRKKEEVEEKLKEIDEKLDEVVSAGVSKKESEKTTPLDDVTKTVQLDENLLEEMETASKITANSEISEDAQLPDVPDLPELNSDLDMDFEEISLTDEHLEESEDVEEEYEEEEEIEFDEEDDLISSLAKEVEVKEEEEIDLLRDLKGQKFSAEELERELQEAIQRLKALPSVR